jgi:hypothetical protein
MPDTETPELILVELTAQSLQWTEQEQDADGAPVDVTRTLSAGDRLTVSADVLAEFPHVFAAVDLRPPKTVTVVSSLSWLDETGQVRLATIGDVVTVPAALVDDHPHAFRETGGEWSPPPPADVDDLDKLRSNVATLIDEGVAELAPALDEIDAAIVERDTPPPPVDPDLVPLTVTPAELRQAGASARVIAKVLAAES